MGACFNQAARNANTQTQTDFNQAAFLANTAARNANTQTQTDPQTETETETETEEELAAKRSSVGIGYLMRLQVCCWLLLVSELVVACASKPH